jgi:hypothetical protein
VPLVHPPRLPDLAPYNVFSGITDLLPRVSFELSENIQLKVRTVCVLSPSHPDNYVVGTWRYEECSHQDKMKITLI